MTNKDPETEEILRPLLAEAERFIVEWDQRLPEYTAQIAEELRLLERRGDWNDLVARLGKMNGGGDADDTGTKPEESRFPGKPDVRRTSGRRNRPPRYRPAPETD